MTYESEGKTYELFNEWQFLYPEMVILFRKLNFQKEPACLFPSMQII